MEGVRAAVERAQSGRVPGRGERALSADVPLPAAVTRPRIGCAAGNYAITSPARHAEKGWRRPRAGRARRRRAVPSEDAIVQATRERDEPRGFWKDFANPVGPGGTIHYPDRAEQLDYEGEVVAVIGRTAKDVEAGSGAGYIWGVSLMNDWSIRGDSPRGKLSFNLSKNFDGSASLGPCIVVGDLEPARLAGADASQW